MDERFVDVHDRMSKIEANPHGDICHEGKTRVEFTHGVIGDPSTHHCTPHRAFVTVFVRYQVSDEVADLDTPREQGAFMLHIPDLVIRDLDGAECKSSIWVIVKRTLPLGEKVATVYVAIV
jgi:hypothetical protein